MRRFITFTMAAAMLASCVAQTIETTDTSAASSSSAATHQPSSTTSTTTPPTTETAVYFFFQGYPVEPGPYVVPVARQIPGDLESALGALLEGVTPAEAELGLSSAIPVGTRLLGVQVDDGIAAIDLTGEFESGGGSLSVLGRVAQVVYTATRFEDVDSVEFLIDGEPVDVLTGEGLIIDEPQTRAGYIDLTPPILVDSPLWGATVESAVWIEGQARADSGMVSYVLVDADGLIVAEGEVTTEQPGVRSAFEVLVDLPDVPHPGLGSIIVFEPSSEGTQLHVLEYPLHFE